MNIVVAPDSFKESISSLEAGKIIGKGFKLEIPNATVNVFPMADGGEGTLETLIYATNGKRYKIDVTGPLGKRIKTEYGILGDGKTVVIEIAKIAGLTMVPVSERNPMKTTTVGVGEVMLDALTKGYRKFIIGLGGSATNDGGLGMLQALGVLCLDEVDQAVPPFASSLCKVRKIDLSTINQAICKSEIKIASDVMNPLCGKDGASYVFGAQKGATTSQIEQLDSALSNYADIIESHVSKPLRNYPGAGAAGGLGFAFMLLGAEIQSGALIVAEKTGIRESIVKADWVITGEGKSDYQTMYGKVPSFIAKMAKEHGAKSILISGSLGEGYESLYDEFIGCFSIINRPMGLDDAITNVKTLLFQQSRNVARLIKS